MMTADTAITRRHVLALTAAAGLAAGTPVPAARPVARRAIPGTGESIPVVGLGTWQQFDVAADAGHMDRLRAVVRVLLDGGGSVIDTSPMYGRAEARVGELLAEMGRGREAFIATKVWTRGQDAGIRQMNRSMELLGGPPLDLMQVHNLVDWRTHLDTLAGWKREGRIHYLGVTHYTQTALDDLARVIERAAPDFVQLGYNIGARGAERRVLPMARERGVAILVNRPFMGGALIRRAPGTPPPGWVRDLGATDWPQAFLKFVLGHPAVTCTIPGTDKPPHMRENLDAGRPPFPDAHERERFVRLWREVGG